MCGIAGVLNLREAPPPSLETGQAMLAMIRHRGPDGFGIYRDPDVLLGNARLSIVDLAGGDQPISNEDGTVWIVFNGEIFNHVELRPGLEARGHRFSTHCDTEVVVHLYEEYGPDCLQHLNGQFAIAIWDRRQQTLFLARDRMGVRPIFYTINAGRLIFGSEVKALLAAPGVQAEIDPAALDETFVVLERPQPPRSIFRDVAQIPPGHYLLRAAARSLCCASVLDGWTSRPRRRPARRGRVPGGARGPARRRRAHPPARRRAGGQLPQRRARLLADRGAGPQACAPARDVFDRLRGRGLRRERLPDGDGARAGHAAPRRARRGCRHRPRLPGRDLAHRGPDPAHRPGADVPAGAGWCTNTGSRSC